MELINPKLKKLKKSVWVIIHVNIDYLYRIDSDLDRYASKYGLDKGVINSYIPTVRILRKKLKGKMLFETVPLLFTYGFIQLPKIMCTENNIAILKNTVPGIHSFVGDISNGNRISFATKDEITTLYDNLIDTSVYDKLDLSMLKEGNIVKLHGYPFDNLDVKILNVNYETEKVKVEMLDESFIKTAEVDFDNIIWTIYHQSQNIEGKEVLLGDLKSKFKTNITKYE